jgi:hypothetical protein
MYWTTSILVLGAVHNNTPEYSTATMNNFQEMGIE